MDVYKEIQGSMTWKGRELNFRDTGRGESSEEQRNVTLYQCYPLTINRLCRLRGARVIALLLLSLICFGQNYLLLPLNCGTTVKLNRNHSAMLSLRTLKKSFLMFPSKFQTTKPELSLFVLFCCLFVCLFVFNYRTLSLERSIPNSI